MSSNPTQNQKIYIKYFIEEKKFKEKIELMIIIFIIYYDLNQNEFYLYFKFFYFFEEFFSYSKLKENKFYNQQNIFSNKKKISIEKVFEN